MNFLCENCKQKYHVADEKLRGRAVTKFKCKKCEHIIEVKASDVPPPGAPGSDTAADHAGSESIPPSTGNTGTMAAFTAPKPAPTPSTAGTTAPSAPSSTASPLPTASTSAKPAFGTSAPRPAGSLPTAAPRPAGASGGGLPTRAGSSPAMAATATASATAAKVSPIGSAKPFGSAQPATTSAPLGAAASKPAAPTNPSANSNNNALRSSLNQNADNRATVSNSATSSAQTDGPRRKDSSTSALLNSSETGWYAGVRDVPVGPLTRAEMLAKIDSGDVTGETLVWREGLDDWRALQQVNELSDLLREASKKIGESVIGTTSKRSNPPNNVVPISRANTAKEMTDEPEESTRLSSLSDLIATAEGAPAAKKAPVAQPPAAQPVKTAPKVEAKPAPKAELKSEPARPAVAETPKPKAEPPPAAKEAPAPAAAAPAVSAAPAATSSESDLDDDSLDNDFFKKIPGKSAAAPSPTPAPAASNAAVSSKPAEPAKDAFVMAAPAVAAAPAAAVVSTPAPTMSAGLASISEAPKPEKKEKEERRSGGVPMGVWVLVGGLVIAAGGGGMYAGTRINQQPPQPVVQPTPQPTQNTTATPRLDPQIAAPININTPDPPQTPPTPANTPPTPTQGAATAPEQHPAANSGGATTARVHAPSTTGGHAPSTGGGSSSGGLTAEQRAEMQRLLGGNGVAVGPGTGGPTIAARSNTAENTAPVQGPTGSARAAQVLETFSRTGVVRSCWQQQITRNPAHPAERLAVTLTVGSTGRATDVRVAGANDPALATCISNRARSQNFGPGGTVDAQANFNLAIGQ